MTIKIYIIKNIIKHKNKENKIISKEELFLVPTTDILNQLLYKFHTFSIHSNFKELKAIFYKNKVGFLGLDSIIQEYIKISKYALFLYKLEEQHID